MLHLPCSLFLVHRDFSLKHSYILLSSLLFFIAIYLDYYGGILKHKFIVPPGPEISEKFLKLNLSKYKVIFDNPCAVNNWLIL